MIKLDVHTWTLYCFWPGGTSTQPAHHYKVQWFMFRFGGRHNTVMLQGDTGENWRGKYEVTALGFEAHSQLLLPFST